MAPSQKNNNSHSEAAKMEQIITEFFAKGLHIILGSRAPLASSSSSSSSPSSSVRSRDKWFNLALRECPEALENIDLWRQSNLDPVVVDVILVQKPVNRDSMSFSPKRVLRTSSSMKERYNISGNTDFEELGIGGKSERIIERWVLKYESRKMKSSNSSSKRSSGASNSRHILYKKLALLLRSLYSTLRLLPAHKIFRDLTSLGKIPAFTLAHRVCSFEEPITRKEEGEMQNFEFTPVDTQSGRLCLSVKYRPFISDVSSEPILATPMSPRVIPNYVGSPMADPMKRFTTFSRRHSWSFDHYGASPPPSNMPSPSPSLPESHTLVSNVGSRHVPPTSLPPPHQNNATFDEYYPSPNMSPSPSPSPPIYGQGSLLSKSLARSESAPVSIPIGISFPPSSPLRGSRYSSKMDGVVNNMQTGAIAEKSFSIGRDEFKKYYATKTSSNSSPRFSVSRGSSRSYPDDYDDLEFTSPFDVDDDDVTDPGSRPESFDHNHVVETGGFYPIKKSQDAAVGALVHMLKKAPPLRQDLCASEDLSQGTRPEPYGINPEDPNQTLKAAATPASATSSGVFTRKTTSDALEEFQSYREMKNLLLMQDGKPQI